MIEVMVEAMNALDQLTFGLGRSIIMIIPISIGLSTIFKITRMLCVGERIIETPSRSEPARSEPIRADPPKVNLKKGAIDNDLKKYFDYDVKR